MENIDNAREEFARVRQFAEAHVDQIVSEADARFQLIDRILLEVLGWRRDGIRMEPPTESGYIDYLISTGGRNAFVVEAKRTEKALVTTKSLEQRYYKVGGSALRDAQDGLAQAASYCASKSVPFAALTNGFSWIGFRALRVDGVEYRDGVAAVFPDLNAIQNRFAEFYDLFSQEGVRARLYSVYLDREEGSALSAVDPLLSVVPPSEIYLMRKSDLARDMDQIFNEFFKTLTGDSDQELLAHCFVDSPESHEADRTLEKITRELVSYVQSIKDGAGLELQQEIEASVATKKGQMVVIVGNKGAGKSTFIDRFFKFKLDRSLREKCLVLKVDLADSPGSIDGLQEWLTDRLNEAAEQALYAGRNPSYDELQGIFFDHYQRWSTGEHKHLYDTDIDAFKIKFGEFISDRRRDKPDAYLTSVLKRAIRQRCVIPCVVFDNADNFPIPFQDAVFQYAYALFRAVAPSVVVVPITDRTIWRLSKAGALQSYSAKALFLPVPSTKSVLEKRVMFIKRKLDEGPEKSQQYFTSRGLRITMENLPAFAACVEEAFIRTDYIARRIGALTNFDLRRGLELSQKIITAPILKVDELVTAYFASRNVQIQEKRIVQALLYGEYNKFKQEAHEYLLDLFSLETGFLNSPMLRLSVLRLLLDKENAASDVPGAYIAFEEVDHYFENMGVPTRCVLAAVEVMVKYRLIEPYEPNSEVLTPTTRIAVTPSGHMHFEMAFNEVVYIEQMALTTPLRSEEFLRGTRGLLAQKMGSSEWTAVRREFARYCLEEDSRLMNFPTHADYQSQVKVRREFERWSS
ncbi:hypothetical protein [Polaromonas sp.]|uniref:hypothetical protein n=1 Tax=Polaromonas sp. TaxID=1869339 RepID=UPI002FC5BC2E